MITSTDLLAAVDALRAIADQLERVAGKQLAGTDTTQTDKHPLVDQIVAVTTGKHRGKEGRVSGVYPSKFNPGEFYATIHPTTGDKFYADLGDIHVMTSDDTTRSWRKPAAPSVRRPTTTRKLNGSVPW